MFSAKFSCLNSQILVLRHEKEKVCHDFDMDAFVIFSLRLKLFKICDVTNIFNEGQKKNMKTEIKVL